MALTRAQFDEAMRTLSERRQQALRESNLRQEEINDRLPAVFCLNEEILDLASREVAASLRKNTAEAERIRSRRAELTGRKTELIRAAGYPDDYDRIRYFCSECGDTGYIGGEKCGCLKKLESEILMRESGIPAFVGHGAFSAIDTDIYDCVTEIDELRPKRVTQRAYIRNIVLPGLKSFLDNFGNGGKRNILMFGPAGTGKTFFAGRLASELIDRQYSVAYERAGAMFELMTKAQFSKEEIPEAASLMSRLSYSEVLILDDLGTEFVTELTKSKFFSLISDRLNKDLSTIITTNMSLSQLREAYTERISSRFMGDFLILPFYGKDLRILGRQ